MYSPGLLVQGVFIAQTCIQVRKSLENGSIYVHACCTAYACMLVTSDMAEADVEFANVVLLYSLSAFCKLLILLI